MAILHFLQLTHLTEMTIHIKAEVSPFFRKISNCTEVKIFKKILVGIQNAIQFLCQYLLLFQLVT
jgi:hypothetical protein